MARTNDKTQYASTPAHHRACKRHQPSRQSCFLERHHSFDPSCLMVSQHSPATISSARLIELAPLPSSVLRVTSSVPRVTSSVPRVTSCVVLLLAGPVCRLARVRSVSCLVAPWLVAPSGRSPIRWLSVRTCRAILRLTVGLGMGLSVGLAIRRLLVLGCAVLLRRWVLRQ